MHEHHLTYTRENDGGHCSVAMFQSGITNPQYTVYNLKYRIHKAGGMRKLIMGFLLIAPFTDYTYSFKVSISEYLQLSPARVFKLIPLFLFLLYFPLRPERIFLWKKNFSSMQWGKTFSWKSF